MNIRALIATIVDFIFPRESGHGRNWASMSADVFERSVASATYDDVLTKAHASALFSYNDPLVKEAIHALKYQGEKRVADIFGTLIAKHIMEEIDTDVILASGKLMVVPIPVSFERHIERGYNQTELIGRAVVERLSDYLTLLPDLLVRRRYVGSQTQASTRRERALNVRGAFIIHDASRIKGKDILLIDDVITTSATISEAAAMLHSAGARSVFAIAVAH